jgi:hypothetical protein
VAELADPTTFFVIVISADTWKRLDERQRRALVDHELCHCVVSYDDDGMPVLSTRTHDIEEFGSIIDRHGLWTTHLAVAGTAIAEQLVLAVEEVQEFLDDLDDSRKEQESSERFDDEGGDDD